MNNYTVFHLHSMLSNGITNIDSVTKFDEYINYAHELGMTSIGFSEHGSVFEHIKKRQTCEKLGMKYLHGEEFYVTEKLVDNDGNKIKDNYHVIIIAKNYAGYLELNKLSTQAFNRATVKMIDDKERYYYSPRITFDELISTSDNLIITTACLGGVLNKGSDELQERFIKFLADNKFITPSLSQTAKQERERFLKDIQCYPLYDERKFKRDILKNNIVYFNDVDDCRHLVCCSFNDGWRMLEEAKMCRGNFIKSLYSNLCAETHVTYYGLMKYEQQNNIKPSPRLTSLYLSCAFLSYMLAEIIIQDKGYEKVFNGLHITQQQIIRTFVDIL